MSMSYVNVKVEVVRSPEMAGCDDARVGTWTRLSAYCVEKENGGRIAGCANWTQLQQQRLLGIDPDALEKGCPLWSWDGPDLLVAFYPLEQERRFQMRRELGRKGGKAPKRPPDLDMDQDKDSDKDKDKDKDEEEDILASANAKANAKANASEGNVTSNEPPPPPDLLVEIPATDGSYVFTDAHRQTLEAEYPTVDALTVAEDMAKKKRTGARPLKTTADTGAELARWVAQEAKDGGNGEGGTYTGMRPPAPDEWIYGYSEAEWSRHHADPLWEKYTDVESDRCGWGGELRPWRPFETFKHEHAEAS